MSVREEQREQREKTSRALIEAALELSAAEGYASLSLRSVARQAGIAPTSFYRHFRDMDELGLAIVDQAREALRTGLDKARKKLSQPGRTGPSSPRERLKALRQATRPWVETVMECVDSHGGPLRLFFQERTGSSSALRKAITAEMEQLTQELADDLQRLGKPRLEAANALTVAEAILTMTASAALDRIVQPHLNRLDLTDRLTQKISWTWLGAAALHD
jgi:AcrR family transcriptional regulator